jgi:hypothetical protein
VRGCHIIPRYKGSIAGIKIGDPEATVRSLMGNPINKPMNIIGANVNLQYALDDTAFINFSINIDGVQTISINK